MNLNNRFAREDDAEGRASLPAVMKHCQQVKRMREVHAEQRLATRSRRRSSFWARLP
jgi:hypothetical protein